MAVVELDYLTDLPNRKSLYQYYLELPQDGTVHARFLDVDNFKKVNDIYGHNMGDQLLVGIADFLQEVLEGCFIARLGGDEFAVILPSEILAEDVPAIAELLLIRFKEMEFRQDVMSLVSLSIGVLVDNSVTEPLDDILAKKVIRKLETQNPIYLRNSAEELLSFIDDLFGADKMPLCKEYVHRLQRNA